MRFSTPILAAALAGPAALAQVAIFPKDALITTEQTCRFTAGVASASQPEWEFRVVEPGGGRFTRDEHGGWLYVPPAHVFGTETYRIRVNAVSDPGAWAETTIRVGNGTELVSNATQLGNLIRQILGEDYVPRMDILAGRPDQIHRGDGTGAKAGFNFPGAMVYVPSHPDDRIKGNWLVADTRNNQIRVVNARTGAVWTWLGDLQADHADGQGLEARFNWPMGLAVQGEGASWRLLISDCRNHVIRAADAKGNVTTLAGSPGQQGFQNGEGAKAVFNGPTALAVDREGAIYVADTENHVIRKIVDGKVSRFAGKAWPVMEGARQQVDGPLDKATFFRPRGLAVDDLTGDLYVSVSSAVRRISRQGRVATVAGSFHEGGFEEWRSTPLAAGPLRFAGVPCLNLPMGLAMSRGQLFIVDLGNTAIRTWDPVTGELATVAGGRFANGASVAESRPGKLVPDDLSGTDHALLGCPSQIAFDDEGGCLVSMRSCLGELSLDRRGRLVDPRQAPDTSSDQKSPSGLETKAER